MITITGEVVGAREAAQDLERIAARLERPRAFFAEAGQHLSNTLRNHFRTLDARGNKHGWPSRHFFLRQGRDATALTAISETGAEVTVASPEMAHKLDGGTVTPKRGQYLAIPNTAEAYQVWPRNWQGDRLFRPRGKNYLATSDGQTLTIQYFLVRQATHEPDPDVLPDLDREADQLLQIALRHIDRQIDI
jgi:hypothetical protein